ncbi:Uncharacterised protein [Burkholderia oklahomensis]|nr:trans-aconitate methyltransferase [Burkholderia oklahomensis]SUW54858.1 Uncharacterised protein [Burkholderia oklahomensis]
MRRRTGSCSERVDICTSHLDIRRIDGPRIVEGGKPVFERIEVVGLRIVADGLADDERSRLLERRVARPHALHSRRDEGRTPFPFKRPVIVAQAPSR